MQIKIRPTKKYPLSMRRSFQGFPRKARPYKVVLATKNNQAFIPKRIKERRLLSFVRCMRKAIPKDIRMLLAKARGSPFVMGGSLSFGIPINFSQVLPKAKGEYQMPPSEK